MIARVTLASGKTVLDTGRVLIGIRAPANPPRDPGVSAEVLQRVLCAPMPRQWEPAPREFHVSPSFWQRLVRAVRSIFNHQRRTAR